MELNHFIINAISAKERLHNISSVFHRLGLEPRFFPAIMGNQLTKDQIGHYVDDGGLLTLGEIGCALSHLSIYKKFLQTNEKYIFVFEDDVEIRDDFPQLAPAVADFIGNQKKGAVLLLYKAKAHTRKVQSIGQSSVHILRSMAGSAAHGYVINRVAAENILKAQTPLAFEIDAWALYYKLLYLDIFCLNQNVVFLNQELANASLIDAVDNRHTRSSRDIKKIKDYSFQRLLRRYSWEKRLFVEYKRLERHIDSLFYDEDY
ncbi:glycosyltransferase family 25 protein [Megasphaera indica]